MRFIMIVGVPGSGKSTFAKTLEYEVISSDAIREELGSVEDQSHNQQVFSIMAKRTLRALNDGKDVVYDATNLRRADRMNILKQLPQCDKICYVMDTALDECLERNRKRERHVPENVIRRMWNKKQEPILDEGWNCIVQAGTL